MTEQEHRERQHVAQVLDVLLALLAWYQRPRWDELLEKVRRP